jgi:hypothetical protein
MGYYEKLNELKFKKEKNIDEILREKEEIKKNEIGMVHPTSGSGIIIKENGNVDFFADNGLGVQFNKEKKTISFYGSKVKFFCSDFKIINQKEVNYEMNEEWKEIIKLLEE